MKKLLLLVAMALAFSANAQTYSPIHSTTLTFKNGNTLVINPPAFGTDHTWILPPANAAGVLTNDGSGILSWAAAAGTGTVTSVNGSGGTTGLTLGGGPITVSGTLTLGGTLGSDNGGTGKTNADLTGQAGKALVVNVGENGYDFATIGGGSGTVTNVTGNAPISVINNSTTPDISISQANATTNGFLHQSDWNMFDSKLSQVYIGASTPLTGMGTFGNPLTMVKADATTNGFLHQTDWTTFNDKLSQVYINGGTPITGAGTFASPLTMAQASGSTNGYLSSADYAVFFAKGNGTVTQFNFTNGGGFTGNVTNGTSTPTLALTLNNDAVSLGQIQNAGANSVLVGSGDAGSGANYTEITLGSGLAMTGTVLSATGGALSGGTNNVVTKWTGATSVGTSSITDDGTDVSTTSNLKLTGSNKQLSFKGNSTGVTTFAAGTQGATNINYTLPTIAPTSNGQVLASTTAGVMSWTAQASGTEYKKSADESIISSTALQSDNHITGISIGANEAWSFEGFFLVSIGHQNGDFKFAFVGTQTMTVVAFCQWDGATGITASTNTTIVANAATSTNNAIVDASATALATVRIRGTIVNGANANTVELQWAQNGSNGNATTLQNGSYLIFKKMR